MAGARIDPRSGHVVAATQVFEDRKGLLLDAPVWIVQVEFFGAIGSLFGRLEVGPDDDIDIGMPVELVPTDKVGRNHVVFRPVA